MNTLEKELSKIKWDVWVYDVQVYLNYWVATFANIKTKQIVTFENDYKGLKEFYYSVDGLFGGFNNRYYDNYILKAILNEENPYNLSNHIILLRQPGHNWGSTRRIKLKNPSFDVMELISNERVSLKKYKAFLGLDLGNLNIPYEFQGELNLEQQEHVKKFNINNVKTISKLLIKFMGELSEKLQIIERYKISLEDVKRTSADLSSLVIGAKYPLNRSNYESFKFKAHDTIKQIYNTYFKEYSWIINKLEEHTYQTKIHSGDREQLSFPINLRDYVVTISEGGAHGSLKNYISQQDETLLYVDYVSNYPNIMKNFDLVSDAAPEGKARIEELLKLRNEAKKNKNSDLPANFIKKILVSIYGTMNYKYNTAWDPKKSLGVCFSGQLLILALHWILEPFGSFIQVNTDGLIIKLNNKDLIPEVNKKLIWWQQLTKMPISYNVYSRIYQKDVNNFLLVKNPNDKKTWKAKGQFLKYFNSQFHNSNYNQASTSHNNVLSIIDEAVANNLVLNIPIMTTLKECKDLIRFQYICTLKDKYKFFVYKNQAVYEPNGTLRVFFTKSGSSIRKGYESNGEILAEKYSYTSERCSVYNGNITKLSVDDVDLDYEYYESLVNDIILGIKGSNVSKSSGYSSNIKSIKFKFELPKNSTKCFMCQSDLNKENNSDNEPFILFNKEVCKECYMNELFS